jgi:hypothetical protein
MTDSKSCQIGGGGLGHGFSGDGLLPLSVQEVGRVMLTKQNIPSESN